MSYVNMIGTWFYKKLIKATDLEQLAANDEWLKLYSRYFETGTIAHNNTIALPSGWTAIDNAFVSVNNLPQNDFDKTFKIDCSVSPSFLVTCQYYYIPATYPVDPEVIYTGTANYLIIGH